MPSFWRRWRRRLRALSRMSLTEWSLAVECLVMLAAARFLVKTSPRSRFVSRLGGTHPDAAESADTGSPDRGPQTGTGARVGAMLERVAGTTWWRSMCLEKALAG